MSQLVKAVMATDTGHRKMIQDKTFSPLFQDVFSRQEHLAEGRDVNFYSAKIYKIGITLGNQVAVSDLDIVQQGNDALQEAIVRVAAEIGKAMP